MNEDKKIDLNEFWKAERFGKFTSSKIPRLCAKEGFGKTGLSYIRTRVFESIAGVSSDRDFLNEYSANGLVEENFGIKKYMSRRGIKFVVVQKLIYGEDPLFSCTPDAIYPITESIDKLSYSELETWEIKCFSPERHMSCIEAETPLDVKKIDSDTYWQALDQSVNCGAKTFKIIYYNPDLPEDKGGLHVIDGIQNKSYPDEKTGKPDFPIVKDIAFLKQRKAMAVAEFNRIKQKLSS